MSTSPSPMHTTERRYCNVEFPETVDDVLAYAGVYDNYRVPKRFDCRVTRLSEVASNNNK